MLRNMPTNLTVTWVGFNYLSKIKCFSDDFYVQMLNSLRKCNEVISNIE
jgi:hypothetical protein